MSTPAASVIPADRLADAPSDERISRIVVASAWCLAIVLALGELWHARFHVVGDSISYLDIGDSLARGDWASGVNAYWSPLYPWLLGIAIRVVDPSPYWEFAVIGAVNFFIFLFALASFHALITALVAYHRAKRARFFWSHSITFPTWAWLALGYGSFLWSSLHVISIARTTPDVLLSGIVYLTSALLLRIGTGDTRWRVMCALGVCLGVGYLTKAPMFPLAPVFLICAALAIADLRTALPRVGTAIVVFALVAGPQILAISRAKNRFTFSEAGRLNFVWDVNGIARAFWLGGPPENGMPVHPPRKIHEAPEAFEFARPIHATYPIWHDPSYWYEGVVPRLAFPVTPLRESRWLYENLFREQTAFVAGILFLYLLGARARTWARHALSHWPILIPAAAALTMFAMAGAEGRYVGPFVLLLMLAALSTVRLPDRGDSRRVLVAATIVMLLFLVTDSLVAAVRLPPVRETTHVNFEVAQRLERLGIRRGDRLAVLRTGGGLYWARLAGVQIVAEIPSETEFWRADAAARRDTITALAATGARLLLTHDFPAGTETDGWTQLGNTEWYAYPLQEDPSAR